MAHALPLARRTHPRASLCGVALAVVLCAGLGGPWLRAQTAPAAPLPSLAQVRQKIDRGHAADALADLDRMAAQNPVPSGVQRLRGIALYAQNKLVAAEQAFAAATQQDPTDREAVQLRGITLYRLGRPALAIPLLEQSRNPPKADPPANSEAPSAHPDTPVDPQYVLALCYLDTRRYDDARAAFAAQYGFPPESAPAYLLAARMLLRREYIPVAQESARKALALSPNLPLAHLLLGEAALAQEHLDEAITELEQERRLNPLYPSTYDRLGDAYVRRGDFAKARQSLQEAILLEPDFTGPFILLGKVLLKQQDPASASTYLERARQMDPQNYMTHSLLGQAYRQMGRADEARRETDTAEKLQAATTPKLTDAH